MAIPVVAYDIRGDAKHQSPAGVCWFVAEIEPRSVTWSNRAQRSQQAGRAGCPVPSVGVSRFSEQLVIDRLRRIYVDMPRMRHDHQSVA